MKPNKTQILTGIIIVLILFIIFMFAVKPFVQNKLNEQYNKGVSDAVVSIMYQASQCQAVPLTFGNSTLNIIAVDCLEDE